MTVRARLARLARTGVVPGLSASDERHVVLTNVTALSALVILFLFALPIGVGDGTVLDALVVLLQMPPCVLALWLNHRRRAWAATVVLVLAAFTAWIAQTFIYGTSARHHMFLLVLAAALPLVFPRRHRATMWVFLVAALVVLVAFVAVGDAIVPVASLDLLGRGLTEALLVIGMFTLLATLGIYAQRTTTDAEEDAAREHAKSEALLANMLPDDVVARLKARPDEPVADRVDEVTVLFADIAGFTEATARLAPDEVVRRLNVIFTAFDELARAHGLEKIKTIGDAYMAVAGVPSPRPDHAPAAATMALAMLERAKSLPGLDDGPLRVRIGLHTGPVVAGVIGKGKLAYDVWGDTVNTASRMESTGEPGRIHVSSAVMERLDDTFVLEPRGDVAVKGKGTLRTGFLVGTRT